MAGDGGGRLHNTAPRSTLYIPSHTFPRLLAAAARASLCPGAGRGQGRLLLLCCRGLPQPRLSISSSPRPPQQPQLTSSLAARPHFSRGSQPPASRPGQRDLAASVWGGGVRRGLALCPRAGSMPPCSCVAASAGRCRLLRCRLATADCCVRGGGKLGTVTSRQPGQDTVLLSGAH